MQVEAHKVVGLLISSVEAPLEGLDQSCYAMDNGRGVDDMLLCGGGSRVVHCGKPNRAFIRF